MKPIRLTPRLAAAAALVPPGARVIDVGCDHAQLAVFLRQSGRAQSVIAADLREGPLAKAAETVAAAGLAGEIPLLLSDGLQKADPARFDTVIICGMGGDTMAAILEDAPYLKNDAYTLVLQPQTARAELRRYLRENGFAVLTDTFAFDHGRLYNLLLARYDGKTREVTPLSLYLHESTDIASPLFPQYLAALQSGFRRRIEGLSAGHADEQEIAYYKTLLRETEEYDANR